MQSYFLIGQIFLPKYWLVNKYSNVKWILFPKKGKRIKSKFWMVNLYNGETKDVAELWEIIHLTSNNFFCLPNEKKPVSNNH